MKIQKLTLMVLLGCQIIPQNHAIFGSILSGISVISSLVSALGGVRSQFGSLRRSFGGPRNYRIRSFPPLSQQQMYNNDYGNEYNDYDEPTYNQPMHNDESWSQETGQNWNSPPTYNSRMRRNVLNDDEDETSREYDPTHKTAAQAVAFANAAIANAIPNGDDEEEDEAEEDLDDEDAVSTVDSDNDIDESYEDYDDEYNFLIAPSTPISHGDLPLLEKLPFDLDMFGLLELDDLETVLVLIEAMQMTEESEEGQQALAEIADAINKRMTQLMDVELKAVLEKRRRGYDHSSDL